MPDAKSTCKNEFDMHDDDQSPAHRGHGENCRKCMSKVERERGFLQPLATSAIHIQWIRVKRLRPTSRWTHMWSGLDSPHKRCTPPPENIWRIVSRVSIPILWASQKLAMFSWPNQVLTIVQASFQIFGVSHSQIGFQFCLSHYHELQATRKGTTAAQGLEMHLHFVPAWLRFTLHYTPGWGGSYAELSSDGLLS